MEAHSRSGVLYVMGRLRTVAPRRQRRGHQVTVSAEGRILASTETDSAGRFLLEWPDNTSEDRFVFQLLNADQGVAESLQLARSDLVSPPVVTFLGDSILGSPQPETEADSEDSFEADGDYPACVTSSCQQVTLSWRAPNGSTVSILSGGNAIGQGLGARGTLDVFAEGTKSYTRRAWPRGDSKGFSDLTIEVRRYPAMSLVIQDDYVKSGSIVEFGLSTSCPAEPGGLLVTVLTSDSEMVPQFEIQVPSGSTWGETKVKLGRKTGRAKVTATAPGQTRDGMTLVVE